MFGRLNFDWSYRIANRVYCRVVLCFGPFQVVNPTTRTNEGVLESGVWHGDTVRVINVCQAHFFVMLLGWRHCVCKPAVLCFVVWLWTEVDKIRLGEQGPKNNAFLSIWSVVCLLCVGCIFVVRGICGNIDESYRNYISAANPFQFFALADHGQSTGHPMWSQADPSSQEEPLGGQGMQPLLVYACLRWLFFFVRQFRLVEIV